MTLATALATAYALTALSSKTYVASARIMLPQGALSPEPADGVSIRSQGASRIVKIEYASHDARRAAGVVNEFVRAHAKKDVMVIDEPRVGVQAPPLALNLALAAVAGSALGVGTLVMRRARRRPVRHESDLVAALGEPLLAARPLQREALRGLCRQLLEHWFTPRRRLLAIASPSPGDGRSHLAAQLALEFAALGVATLLIDADLRSPGQHRLFRLPNRWGLAGFLNGGMPKPAACLRHLSVLMAGSPAGDPLELLSRERLGALLGEAAKRFQVVLIDTPAASRGPDFEIFAAHAGGALVVARKHYADAAELEHLNARLKSCSARVVATILNAL